jgi:hypothetical protein
MLKESLIQLSYLSIGIVPGYLYANKSRYSDKTQV